MVDDNQQNQPAAIGAMSFLDHLEELRRRLLKSILTIIVLSMTAFYFREELMAIVIRPFGDNQLHSIEVTGAFYSYLKVSFYAGLLASLPIVFYQMWSFISPGLYRQEKSAVLPMVFVSTILFITGASFCYLMALPLSLKFLIGFSGELLTNTITISSYISFVGLLMLAFGFGFQMPILAYFLGKVGAISSSMLARGRRYAVVIILIVGAIITPPDVFTQFLLAVPMYLLYEVSIVTVRLTGLQDKAIRAKKASEASDS